MNISELKSKLTSSVEFFKGELAGVRVGRATPSLVENIKDQGDISLGYVKVKEAKKLKTTPNDAIRQINLQTLISIKIAGVLHKIRK
jgi:ribosome recycling factor